MTALKVWTVKLVGDDAFLGSSFSNPYSFSIEFVMKYFRARNFLLMNAVKQNVVTNYYL